MKSIRNLIMAILAIIVCCNACKKSSTPAPSKSTSSDCLINTFSSAAQSGGSYTGSVIYNTDKTISEVKIVQAGNATIDDRYTYSGNTTTIVASTEYSNGTLQPTISTIARTTSGQVTGIRLASTDGREGNIYTFTYSGENISSASVTRFVDNATYAAGEVTYNYDSNGNLLALFNNDSGQNLISFTYDSTMPAKQGDLFSYYQLSYGENVQLFAFLYPVHNKNLCTGDPGFSPATFTYDNDRNITTMAFANTVYNYTYHCGN